MTTEIETAQTEIRDNAYWPDEAVLVDFAAKDDWEEQAEPPLEDSSAYAILYFVS